MQLAAALIRVSVLMAVVYAGRVGVRTIAHMTRGTLVRSGVMLEECVIAVSAFASQDGKARHVKRKESAPHGLAKCARGKEFANMANVSVCPGD